MKTMTLLLCLALPAAALAAKDRVYRWTDKQGVVHYSQTEPTTVRAKQIEIRRSKEPAATARAPVAPVAAKPAASTANAEYCAVARANAKVLANQKPVSVDANGDGKPDTVTAEDRKKLDAETQKQIEVFCKEN